MAGSQNQFKKPRNSAQAQIFGIQKPGPGQLDGQDSDGGTAGRPSVKNSSPKNNFIGSGNHGRINQKLGPVGQQGQRKYAGGSSGAKPGSLPKVFPQNYQRQYGPNMSGGTSPSLGESRNSK